MEGLTKAAKLELPHRIDTAIDDLSEAAINWERHGAEHFAVYEKSLQRLRAEVEKELRRQYASGYAEGDLQAQIRHDM